MEPWGFNSSTLFKDSPLTHDTILLPKVLRKEKTEIFQIKVKISLQGRKTLLAEVTHYSLCLFKKILESYCLLPFQLVKSLTTLNCIPMPSSFTIVCALTSINGLHLGHMSKWFAINRQSTNQ